MQPPAGAPTKGMIWWLLALAFLVGTAAVSLIELVLADVGIQEEIPIPAEMGEGHLVIVAPGQEHLLLAKSLPESFSFHPSWERLPAREEGYQVLLPRHLSIPRLPEGWSERFRQELAGWQWVAVGPTSPVQRRDADEVDLAQELGRARVFFRGPDGQQIPCDRWRFGRWGCGLEEWLWVGPTQLDMRGVNRSCIWAHPRAGYELVIQFSRVPSGSRLSGRYGLSDSAVAVADGADVGFEVRVGQVERQFVAENRQGFFPYQVPLDGVGEGPIDIEFVVTAENDGRRHFCFSGAIQRRNTGSFEDLP
ncbi:MAG: hypothetical protein JW797_07550 [Bradymonadales bacterium]|nr:hypothetical protein [Bradymonadales bacterium]